VRHPLTHYLCTSKSRRIAVRAALAAVLGIGLPVYPAGGTRTGMAQLPAGLEPLIRVYSPAAEKALKSLKQGVEAFSKGQFVAALRALPDETAAAATSVGDYVLLYRAKSSISLDRGEDALQGFRLLQNRYPTSSLVQEAILGEAQALLKLNRPAEALQVLQDKKAEENAESLFTRAQALEAGGRKNEALVLYLRIFAKYTNSGTASLAEHRLLSLAPAFKASPKNYATMLERADNLLRAGRSRDARLVLLKLAQVKAPDGDSGNRRKLLWAQAELNLGRHTAVIPLLEKLSVKDPAAQAQTIYLRGLCYRKMGREDSFLSMRDLALRLFPQSPFTERLLFSLAGYYDVNNRLRESADAYDAVARHFPKGEYGERSTWRSGLLLYFQDRYADALRRFWEYQNAFPASSGPFHTIYWMGRCYEKLGDGARAAYFYGRCRTLAGDSYYGQRARESEESLRKAGPIPGQPAVVIDSQLAQKWVDSIRLPEITLSEPSKPVEEVLERARQLISADMPDSAMTELRRALRRYPEDRALQYVMSRIYELKDDYFGVIHTLRRAFPDYDARPVATIPQEVWDMLFPMRYRQTIDTEAAKHHLDPNLILAIIRQESAFSTSARSAANARGLMQVLPSTGRGLARSAGISRYTTQKLFRADVNITLGTRFLASLLNDFDQKLEVALVAYNAGSDRAERWMQEFGPADMAEFVDRIPFTETRDYVKQVLTNKAYYRLLTVAPDSETR
jgi:soluble lytic murein transglycosylase